MKLTTEHPASSYGIPVLVDDENNAYGGYDITPEGMIGAAYVMANFDANDALVKKYLSVCPDLFIS